jgi:hypothetical protein
MLDLEPIKKRLEAATPGPWRSCPDDGCKCTAVTCDDYPVANVVKGEWGDSFPSIRLVGETSLNLKAEAFTDQITYGEISELEAMANRAFIREAPNDIACLIAEIERLRTQTGITAATSDDHDQGAPASARAGG